MSRTDLRALLSMYPEVATTEDQRRRSIMWIKAITDKNDLEFVLGLIEHGADVNETLWYNWFFFPGRLIPPRIYSLEDGTYRQGSPLTYALLRNNNRIAETLIKAGAHVNVTDDHGRVPLHHASELDCRITELLVERGANPNATDREGSTPLHLAIRLNNPLNSECLIDAGADVNAIDDRGWAPLHYASEIDLYITELLVEKWAYVNVANRDGLTPLHLAIRLNNSLISECLIKAGADVNAPYPDDQSPLHFASKLDCDITRLLVAKGANVNAVDGEGLSALQVALANNNAEICEVLVKAGAYVNVLDGEGLAPLQVALRDKNRKNCETLIKPGADVNAPFQDCRTTLHIASKFDCNILELLIEKGAYINALDGEGLTALQVALIENNPKICETMLEANADVNAPYPDGRSPLHFASKLDCDITRLLVAKDAHVNAVDVERLTPLHVALGDNNSKICEALLKAGADVNALYQNGSTPLHIASKFNKISIIELLIEKGANLNALDRDGFTPLHVALRESDSITQETLINSGADVNATDDYGFTPLHVSAWRDCPIIDSLIKKGAEVNAEDNHGRSPLHIALLWNRRQVAKSIIEAGGSVNAADHDGLTPLHTAARNGCNLVELLVAKGADTNALDSNGVTPTECALLYRNPTVAEALIINGASVFSNSFCLKYAAMNGYEKVIDLLLKAGTKVTGNLASESTALHWAFKTGQLGCLQSLLEGGACFDVRNGLGQTPLDVARQNITENLEWWQSLPPHPRNNYLQIKIGDLSRELGEKETLCALLRRELDAASLKIEELLAKIDASSDAENSELRTKMEAMRRKTDKIDALYGQMERIVTSIEELKAEKWSRINQSSFMVSADDERDMSSAKSFLTTSFRSLMDSLKNRTSLSEAVTAGDDELVVWLLQKNPDLNARDREKQTPLFLACKYNRRDIARLLLDKGAKMDVGNKESATPLYAASENGYVDVVHLLLERGADVNARTRNDATPLLIAADNGHLLVVEALLKNGSRINAAMKGGYTPLYVAARNDRWEVTRRLLEHGAGANISSDKMMTPLHRAAVEGHLKVMETLLVYGADPDALNAKNETPACLAKQHSKHKARQFFVLWKGMSESERTSWTERKKRKRDGALSSSKLGDLTVQLATEDREMEELRNRARALNEALKTVPQEGDVLEALSVKEITQELVTRQERVSEIRREVNHRNKYVTKNFIIINQGVVHGTLAGNCRDIYVGSPES